jgi:hypothetical protein
MELYGNLNPVEQPVLGQYNPATGWRVIRSWRGLSGAFAVDVETHAAAGRAVNLEPHGQHNTFQVLSVTGATLDGTKPTVILTDLWALLGNSPQLSVWQCPKIQAQMRKIAEPVDRALVRTWINLLARGEQYWNPNVPSDAEERLRTPVRLTKANILGTASLFIGTTDAEFERVIGGLIEDMADGLEFWQGRQYVLKHQFTFFLGTKIPDPYATAGMVLTSDQVLALEDFPSARVPFGIPPGVWLKQTPSIQPLGDDKWQVEYELWWGERAASIYDTPE